MTSDTTTSPASSIATELGSSSSRRQGIGTRRRRNNSFDGETVEDSYDNYENNNNKNNEDGNIVTTSGIKRKSSLSKIMDHTTTTTTTNRHGRYYDHYKNDNDHNDQDGDDYDESGGRHPGRTMLEVEERQISSVTEHSDTATAAPSVMVSDGSGASSVDATTTTTKSQPQPSSSLRNLDEYLETSYQQTKSMTTGQRQHQLRYQWSYWCVILSLGVANSSDASEILCISYILSDSNFQRDILKVATENSSDDGINRGGLLAAAVFFGMLLGGLIVGTMGDWIGRRPMLLVGLACNAVAGVLSAFAPDVWTLSLLRCIAGVGIGATVPPLFTLATELAPPSIRGLCVTLCASFWMVGSVYVALIAMWLLQSLDVSWRVFAIACAVPCALGGVLVYCLVPESPRFLGLEQQSREAVDVANLLTRKMGYHGAPLTIQELEHSFPRSAIHDMQRRQLENNNNINTTSSSSSIGSSGCGSFCGLVGMALRDFVHSTSKLYTREMIQTTWPLQMAWFALSFGSYGLVTWINTIFVEVQLEDVYLNALLFALSNLPGNIIAATLMDRVGRSTMLIASVVASAISLLAFAHSAFQLNSFGVVLSACLFQCFTISAWNTIDTMTSELFPTLIRSTGLGMCAASGRVGAMVAQFVNGSLVGNPVRLLLVASVTMLFGALTPCLLPADMTGLPVNDDMHTMASSGSGRGGGTPSRSTTSKDHRSMGSYQHVSTSSSYQDELHHQTRGHNVVQEVI